MSSVLTIILNWRTPEMTLRSAAEAVAAMIDIKGAITIVDNDSGDGSEEIIRAAVIERGWDRVRVIQSGHNGGFGAGNNVGIRAGLPDGGRPDFVYLLNSDAFPEPDAIRQLRDQLSADPRRGIVGSSCHDESGRPLVSGFRFPSIGSELEDSARTGPITRLLRRYVVPQPIPTVPTLMDWVTGASLMMRQDMLDQIGLFDEGYFLYYEETDLCLRAVRKGWHVLNVPQSRITHIGSVSTEMNEWARTPAYWFDSRWRYFRKNHGLGYALAATAAQVTGLSVNRLRAAIGSSPRKGSRRFMRDLLAHDLRAMFKGIDPEPTHPATPENPRTT